MGELCSGLGLMQKSRADLGSEGEIRRQHLDGYLPFESAIAGAVDDAHPAASDLAFEVERRSEHARDAARELSVVSRRRLARPRRSGRGRGRGRGRAGIGGADGSGLGHSTRLSRPRQSRSVGLHLGQS